MKSALQYLAPGTNVCVVIGCTKMIAASEDQTDKVGYEISELMSLAIEPRRKNELNDVRELEALPNSLI